MDITLLSDNTVPIGSCCCGENGFSAYLEDGKNRILLDCGYSESVAVNANRMGINLRRLTAIVFSNGHRDHTGGFPYIAQFCTDTKIIANKYTFIEKRNHGFNVGSYFGPEKMVNGFNLHVSAKPLKVTDSLTFLGEIPEMNDFEERVPFGYHTTPGGLEEDTGTDDSALMYETEDGIYILSGCSQSGICNITAYAQELSGKPVLGILGGLHMQETDERCRKTIEYLKGLNLKEIYPCHCTSYRVREEMRKELPVKEIAVSGKVVWG